MNKKTVPSEKKEAIINENSVSNFHANFYRDIFNHVPIGIVLYNKELDIIEVNDVFCEMFKIEIKSIQNFNLKDFTDESVIPAFKQALKGFEGFYSGVYHTKFPKSKLYISLHTKPYRFFIDDKDINGGIAIFRDVTEDTLAEQAINKSYYTFQRVTDSIDAIIYVIDPESFKILFMNKKAITIFGNHVQEICYKGFFNNIEKCNTCQADMLKYSRSKLGVFNQFEYYEEKSKAWHKYSYGYIEWIDGRKVMLLTSIDITDLKLAHKKIEEQNIIFEQTLFQLTEQNNHINRQSDQLRISSAIKDTMFSIIAHDLRGPVGNITSALDIILDDINQLTKKDIIEIIKPVRDSAASAYNLLVNLLFWAKNESGETFFIKEEILLNDILADVLTLFKPNIESKALTLVNHINTDNYVNADEHMIHTIIRNLISNAVKYTNSNGIIEISIDKKHLKDKEYIMFSVKDNGVGISRENIQKILNNKEFFSTYGTNKEKGTGIGMILTKEFVERHNGMIEIESTPGTGTDVSIYLPLE
jgi:PAS domain S-box-containing protein